MQYIYNENFELWRSRASFWTLKWGMGHPMVYVTLRARGGHCESVRPQVHTKCSIWDRATLFHVQFFVAEEATDVINVAYSALCWWKYPLTLHDCSSNQQLRDNKMLNFCMFRSVIIVNFSFLGKGHEMCIKRLHTFTQSERDTAKEASMVFKVSAVTPSTPKMLVRVYIALRGSHSHEASNRLQFFLGVGRIAYQIEITGNFYYFIV